MKHLSFLSLCTLAMVSATPVALAANSTDVVVTNVGNERYVGGGNVTVNQAVNGDLTVAGGDVTVNAPVKGSVQAAGGNVRLANTVQGNVRVVGGTIVIEKSINGNLVVAGGSIHLQTGATVAGSVFVMGGDITIDGTVMGTLTVRGGTVTQGGTVRGDTDIQAQQLSLNGKMLNNAVVTTNMLSVGPTASIAKNLRYWTPEGERDLSTVVKGKASYDGALAMPKGPEHGAAGFIGAMLAAATVYMLLSAALLIGLLVAFTKTFFKDGAKYIKGHPGYSFLIGLVYFLLTPVLVILLLVTIIGIPLGIALGLLYILSLMFAKVLTSVVLARYIEMTYKKKWTSLIVFFVSLGLYVLLKAISFIPVLGWIVCLVTVFIGYGAVIRTKYDRMKKIM